MRDACARLPLTWLVLAAAAYAQDSQPLAPPATATAVQEHLTLLTGENAPAARRIGARGLLASAAPEALQSLANLLRTGTDVAAQLAVCEELAQSDAPPVALLEPVLNLLAHPQKELCDAAARAACRFNPTLVIPRLAAIAAVPRQDPAALAAIGALGRLGASPQAVEALVSLRNQTDESVRDALLAAINHATHGRFESLAQAEEWWNAHKTTDLATWLADRDRRRELAAESLDARLNQLCQRLVAALRADYLRRSDGEKESLLLQYLGDGEAAVRALALELINGLITDRRPVPPAVVLRVRALLADPVPDLRRAAASVLGDVRDPQVGAALLDALARESVPRVRAAVLKALGRVADAGVLPALGDILNQSSSTEVLGEAILAIGLVAERSQSAGTDRAAAAAIIAARFDALVARHPALLEPFLETMGRLADPRFAETFQSYLRADHSVVTRQAAIRGAAALANPMLTDQIAALLKDPSAPIRLAAAAALGRCGTADAHLEALRAHLAESDEPDEAVRTKAFESFKRLWESRPLPERLDWIQRLSTQSDRNSALRRQALLAALLASADDDPAHVDLRRTALQLLADAHLELDQPAQALAVCHQAQALHNPVDRGLLVKTMVAAIRAEQPEPAIAALSTLFHTPANNRPGASRPATGSDLHTPASTGGPLGAPSPQASGTAAAGDRPAPAASGPALAANRPATSTPGTATDADRTARDPSSAAAFTQVLFDEIRRQLRNGRVDALDRLLTQIDADVGPHFSPEARATLEGFRRDLDQARAASATQPTPATSTAPAAAMSSSTAASS